MEAWNARADVVRYSSRVPPQQATTRSVLDASMQGSSNPVPVGAVMLHSGGEEAAGDGVSCIDSLACAEL
jgi:hypothetical protein